MDDTQALTIITSMSNGNHPITGEKLEPDSFVRHEDVIRALYVAGRALESSARKLARRATARRPARHGLPWPPEEEAQLLQRFDDGIQDIEKLAELHERRPAGIAARLEQKGRTPPGIWTKRSRGKVGG